MSSEPPALDEPVVILTSARCGSTLLRMLLDAHPALACPPETNLIKVCAQLAAIFDLVGGEADEGTRDVFDAVFAGYLARRGRRRWCEKSLGTAPVAQWFSGLYPKARFICLYRHCFDVIHSGLDASPWGLLGYGFEQFAGRLGGNNAAALAAYWTEHTSRILEFERANQERCLRVHYERLASEPEETAAEIFRFLGVPQVAGITGQCFAAVTDDAAFMGPGDHKIRATSQISADSVGRGVRIPVELIPAPQLKVINTLLAELGYTQVDDAWRTSPWPPVLLAADRPASPASQAAGPAATLGDEMMRKVLAGIGDYISDRITGSFRLGLPSLPAPGHDPAGAGGKFGLVAYHADSQRLARGWQVDIGERQVSEISLGEAIDADWLVTGDVETWLGVLAGRANMASCLRNGALRYIETHQDAPGDTSSEVQSNAALIAALQTERRLATARELLGLAIGVGADASA